jgi:hypothetical protein
MQLRHNKDFFTSMAKLGVSDFDNLDLVSGFDSSDSSVCNKGLSKNDVTVLMGEEGVKDFVTTFQRPQ